MNEYQLTLYTDLMRLVDKNEAFFYKDFHLDTVTYRIFNYRLASYTDFLEPSALQCRGIMFEIDGHEPLRLASFPPEKFFNLGENPMTKNLDFTNPKQIMSKEDGSLISTYSHLNMLRLKTKGSIESPQCVDAMTWLFTPNRRELIAELTTLTTSQHTVNMEWTAPFNRIVLGYEEPNLVVLSVRDNQTGQYLNKSDLTEFPNLLQHWVRDIKDEVSDPVTFAHEIVHTMVDVEGFVFRLNSGQHVKVKTSWYVSLHRTKDTINSQRRLFDAVIDEASDDLRVLFGGDVVALKMIEEMELKVDKIYNHMVHSVELFYENNKSLDRKEYAILGQKELDKRYFSLAMNLYLGRPNDYKDFLKKSYKNFGIKDEDTE